MASVLGVRLGARVVPAIFSSGNSASPGESIPAESIEDVALGAGAAMMGFGAPERSTSTQDDPAAVTISSRTPAPIRALSPAQA
jgi:hypothetical protein